MTTPSVSVIMSAYNAEAYVEAAIDSILAQTYGDFEFLILDDGSTDGTGAILERYRVADERVRVISRENRGLIFSLNQLIEEARAPLIARMDADDIALPERFARQVEFLRENAQFGVVGTCAQRIDVDGRPYEDSEIRCPATHEDFVAGIGQGALLVHSSVMYRKAIVLDAGGYHSAFKHCEDLDLWLRLASRTRICSLPEPLMQYRVSDTQISRKHAVEQSLNAAISIHAWGLRERGQPDPTGGLDVLPAIFELDRFFGEPGAEKAALARVIPEILHSRRALTASGGLDLVARHLALGNPRAGLWRTVLRLLIVFGEWKAALRLAGLLLSPQPSSET